MEDEKKGSGFFKKLGRAIRNILIIGSIIALSLYSIKLRIQLKDSGSTIDSLRNELSSSYLKIDSLKTLQDKEVLMRDSLEDLIDRRLGDRASEIMITIDTTLDASVAMRAIEERMRMDEWVDSISAPYPEGVAAHVKLHYLKSRSVRLERLNQLYSTKFGE